MVDLRGPYWINRPLQPPGQQVVQVIYFFIDEIHVCKIIFTLKVTPE